jgi:hypothetical protein
MNVPVEALDGTRSFVGASKKLEEDIGKKIQDDFKGI